MSSGLKKMLAQGIANEKEQLEKAAAESSKSNEKALHKNSEDATPEPPKEALKKETDVVSKKTSPATKPEPSPNVAEKNKGGRPTNKERGLKSRKRYSLTLKEEDYQEFLNRAVDEEISFAKFMEKAAKEYIKNHW